MNDLEKARKAAEAANAKLAELEAQEAARQAQEAAQRREREEEYARGFLKGWRDRAAEAASVSTSDEYDPDTMGFLEGLIRFAAAREKRRIVLDEARRAESVLEVPTSTIPPDRFYQLDVIGHIERIIRSEAARRVAEFEAELEAERERFINGEG
ncbi:hypothetical protein [Streptomyces sp. NPDC057413]|uniref:hypothetical protein n=1 Tax=Streptomyces sp. NPDC057413 TaxID=3346124 RepID=UPI0036828E98